MRRSCGSSADGWRECTNKLQILKPLDKSQSIYCASSMQIDLKVVSDISDLILAESQADYQYF